MTTGPYFNTTSETNSTLLHHTGKAERQDDTILNFFRGNYNHEYTPEEVHRHLFGNNTPLTSVRRSMTVLTGRGYLVRCETKRMGSYGRMSFTWRLKRTEGRQLSIV